MACLMVVMGERGNRVPGALQQAENVPRADVAVTAKVFTVPQIQGLRSTPVLTEYIMPSFIVVQTETQ